MKFETLSDYCKFLEKNFSLEQMIPTLPVVIRLDGCTFHTWAKGLNKPFDDGLINLMTDTLKFLVHETNAVVGYTQSDEMTLILYSADKESDIYHAGKKQKILSKLTGKCVSYFNERRKFYLPDHNKIANFDCRIYQTPNLADACNQLLWRENDAVKNSISMLAQSLFSHKELQNLNGNQMQEKMLLERDINWNNLLPRYKRGTYVKRTVISKPFTKEEIETLPPRHRARQNPDLVVERNIIEVVEYPIMSKIMNRVSVIFDNAEPILASE